MQRPSYLTPDGHEISKLATSKHHIAWQRNIYNTPTEKKFRESAGFVLRLEQTVHRELHAELDPPPKPDHDLIYAIVDFKKGIPTQDPYEIFEYVTEYMGGLSRSQHRFAAQAGELYDNYAAQQTYIDLGKVSLCI